MSVNLPDFCSNTAWSNITTVTWAAVLLLDSVIYLAGLAVHERYLFRGWYMVSEIVNVFASMVYMVSQGLYYWQNDGTLDNAVYIGWWWASWYLAAFVLWAIGAFIYLIAYIDGTKQNRRGTAPNVSHVRQLAFWAEVFNILPSLGYLASSLYGIIPLQPLIMAARTAAPTDPSQLPATAALNFYTTGQTFNFWVQAIINLPMDTMWTIDAVLFMILWYKDSNAGSTEYVEISDLKDPLLEDRYNH